ncbi:general substrate transporter [Fistulina hepatica ATCC 64428]|uniref:General substrate transporter n=1 Tax=Fistulina hepatica ATCC 64428 TaxID=1128425 RepID=A0A0D7A4H2_9AGAR|nr:general substrate transporter [Fistulina hepatica ATCC 64428]
MVCTLQGDSFTRYGWSVCLWIVTVAFQYGYHISALNQIQAVLSCRNIDPLAFPMQYGLPRCIPMNDFTFSVVTSMFTVGGLVGSMLSGTAMEKYGRRGALRFTAWLLVFGAGLLAVSSSVFMLVLGRHACIHDVLTTCICPVFLSEVSPAKISGSVGILTQMGIVTGIMTTQCLGLAFATPSRWRNVLFFSCALAVAQSLLASFIVESPAWLGRHGRPEDRKAAAHRLWRMNETDAEAPLIDDADARREESHSLASISVRQLLVSKELRTPLFVTSFAMLAQQLCVLYYSNNVLERSLGTEMGPYVSVGITVMNTIMTFAPIYLIGRLGYKQLLLISSTGVILSLVGVGFGLDSGLVILPSIAILTFVMSFALGLGPVPFVMVPEISPIHAVSAMSSVALSLNWIANFFVGLVFLELRDMLAGGDALKEGRVFYVFAVILGLCMTALMRFSKAFCEYISITSF